MSDLLIATKVTLPLLRQPHVARPGLLARLHAALAQHHLLTLISAPAGYGKTTTLRLWVEELDCPVAWLRLDPADNKLGQFLKYVVTALQRAVAHVGQGALEMTEAAREVNVAHVTSLLVNDLNALAQPVVLVLEDYHLLDNPQIDAFLGTLLRQALPTLHLVITTREDPALPLAYLRARNQLTEIRAGDLRFSTEEAAAFLTQVMSIDLPAAQVAILEQRTEGWAAGLQLAALSLRDSHDPASLIRAFHGTHRHVLDYLLEEVLNGQPEEVRRFLRQCSILRQVSAALCEAVTGQRNSAALLRELERNNLFLLPLDDHRTWYRFHALFAELLRHQLMESEPGGEDELHARAAVWYEAHGYLQDAMEHACQMHDRTLLLRLLTIHAFSMFFQGEVATVASWFAHVSDADLATSPMLCISKAWALALMQRSTRRAEVERAIRQAEAALQQNQADAALCNLVRGHIATMQAFLMQAPAFGVANPEKLIETAQKAKQLLPEDEKAIRSVNALSIGYGYAALADLPAAERAYQQAFEDGIAAGNWYAAVYGPIDLIAIALIKGQLKDALQLCDKTIDQFNQLLAGARFPPIGDLYNLKGSILLERNHLAEAEQALTQGVNLLRWTGEYEAQVRGYSALARLRCIQGDRAGMLESVQLLEESRPEVAIYAQAVRHRWLVCTRAADNESLEAARHWIAQSTATFRDLPGIVGVDPVSSMYFQTYLSTAHILTRLARAEAQAYSLLDAHQYFARQEAFAAAHELVGWQIGIGIVRALMYQVEGKTKNACHMIEAALRHAAPRGYFRIFLDERDLIRPLLELTSSHVKDDELSAFVKRLLAAMPDEGSDPNTAPLDGEKLSEREREVLALLAAGQSYKEIGERLFLSLNTVQFHVKNIYGKLLINKRSQAIEKARAMKLI